jgi:ubiquinone/menaquinone biosynthesis C-methylase UbiE
LLRCYGDKINTVCNHKEIYSKHADQYELLVSCEDYQQNIFPALNEIRPLAGLDVVELGAGTGRLTCMLAPVVKTIRAFDASQHMLDVAVAKLGKSGLRNWRVEVADHRHLPVADQVADVAISGWSICYTAVGHEKTWRRELDKAVGEMKRVLRPGGTVIILETLGTGCDTPHPLDTLSEYYAFLGEEGFSSTWIRTDYRFESLAEAEELIRFFFGEDMAGKVVREKWVIVPECTGIWWCKSQ